MKAWSLLKKLMPMLLVFPAFLFDASASTESTCASMAMSLKSASSLASSRIDS